MSVYYPVIVERLQINGISLPPHGFEEPFATPIGKELRIVLDYRCDSPGAVLRVQIAHPFPEEDEAAREVLAYPVGEPTLAEESGSISADFTPTAAGRVLLLLLWNGTPVYRLAFPLKSET